MAGFRVSGLVALEIAEARAWYADRSIFAPLHFNRALDGALVRIAAHPTAHAPWRAAFRRCRLAKFPYLLIFHTDEVFTSVLALVHQRSEPTRLLSVIRNRLRAFD
ncbi:MAG: hypothetical protein HZA93_23280 [Verrucomicrobia bacterium]|nr:hypothetical protein [Verrucomicrobiota bacterium]